VVEPGHTIGEWQNLDTAIVPPAVAQVQQVRLGLGKIGAETQQPAQVFEDAEIIFDDFGRNRAFTCDRRHVQHTALRETGGFTEPAERADVASESLKYDLSIKSPITCCFRRPETEFSSFPALKTAGLT